ncbi:hypothetical protein IAW_05834 [Bacillus cereus str. Schrouff]|uniref:phage replisome organizer N-terminal domain-containing protein n=1 Tax=Bacillus cereus TaxID=1396 RepID=UPI00032DA3EE|nr:phage replisome organizer N-terminal domain-containing protein [Bacillus cereus]EOO05015.1 hypothetical protein IAW_05834 [Bacillus cereus str. Schrouff]EOO81651.1 hypothetical protein IGY_05673 [Bacillus cereus K-5975c]
MLDVKWIKLSTNMFDDEKIRLIESMPEADTLLIIWIRLLAQAGKTNASGYIFLSKNIPYSDEMLATLFNRPIATVRLALKTFQQFRMIEITDDQYICISNWEKHQNIDGLERIREQNRLRKQKQRGKIKLEMSRDGHETITQSHATDIEEDKELEEFERFMVFYDKGRKMNEFKIGDQGEYEGKTYAVTNNQADGLEITMVNSDKTIMILASSFEPNFFIEDIAV